MSGETTMYELKPVVSLPRDLRPTKTIYKMRNIHAERTRDDHTGGEIKIVPDITEQRPLPEFNALEVRQEKILAQLAELKKQVSTLCDFLKQTNESVPGSICAKRQKPIKVNLIINVNPKRPVYSLLALQKIWKDVDVRIETFVHSSVTVGGSISSPTNQNFSNENVINLSLIWKEVEDLELVTGLHGSRITGETNFLRYISRLLSMHNYENHTCPMQINTTDLILDLCHSLYYQESLKKKQEILSTIADKLDTNWLSKGEPTISDIAAWSTIKETFPKKYPSKLKKWFETCENLFV